MSIVTKKGDKGATMLMYNRPVSKCHPRVEAFGAVDELNAAIGLARAGTADGFTRDSLAAIQGDLVLLMGELATAVEDLPRYVAEGHGVVTPDMTTRLQGLVAKIEAADVSPPGWATPGANAVSAALDLAYVACGRFVGLTPELPVAGRAGEPHRHAHVPPRLQDLSLEHVRDTQLSGNVLQGQRLPLEVER